MSLSAGGRGLGAAWSPTHVQVTVLQARGLRAKGPGGTSDAYALIQVGKEKYATSVSERSLGAPVWREEATFELPPLGLPAVPGNAATLQLTVLHRALLGLDKFLGRAEVDLRELHRDQGRRKTQWYTLKSKPGKKEKERGEIEVDIQFMRNNMTASMFDLSMKDKSRNPFGKLRDKIKGKRHEEPSDTASAIVPSTMHTIDSDDDSPTKDKKKKSKIKTLFSRSGLQKTPLSQSMSVLPTAKPEKLTLHPGDFQSQWEDDMEDESSLPSNSMSHRRTASADIKQLSHINLTLPKKEGLSFFGGLRSKNDQLSRSNVCINGNHVYVEQPEPKHEAVTKDSTPSSSPSPQGFRKKHLFSSTENLSSRPSKELGEAGRMSPDWQLSGSLPKDSLKSLTLPSYRPVVSDDVNVAPVNAETEKESKENKKQENRKSSLLSLVTGKKDALKNSEAESSTPSVLMKEKEITPGEAMVKEKEAGLVEIPVKDLKEKTEEDLLASVSRQSKSPSPTEEMPRIQSGAEPELKPEPKSRPPAFSARGPQTKAVKPRLGVSPEAQSKAKFSSSIRDSSLFFSATSSGSSLDSLPPKVGQETESSNSLSLLSSFSPPTIDPVSTSTPIENWPFSQESQASSEGPSFFLAVKSQKEGSIRVSSASSGFPESLDKHSPLHEGNIVSVEETGEIDIGKSKRSRESSRPSLDLLENTEDKHVTKKQKEKVPTFPPVSQTEHLPPPKDPQQNTTLVQDGKHWVKERKEFISSYGASLEGQVSDQGVVPANDGAELPHKMEDLATPFDCIVGKSNLTGLHDRQGRKKIKKHVSFSEELFPEDEVEKEESKPLELKSKGAMNDTLSDREPEEIKKKNMTAEPNSLPSPLISGARATFGLSHDEPASVTDVFLSSASPVSMMPESHGKCSSEDLVRESSSEKVTPFRIERYQNYSENYQSKASDHEGLLSDPLRSLDLVSDLKSPVMGDLNLTLPSIPEVTSDDERVEQLEDVRTTPTTKNHLEKEIPFFGSSATSSEEENLSPSVEQNPDAGVNTLFQEEENALQVEKHEDFVNSSILSSKQTPALSVCKLPHREGLGLDKDIPIPESLEKQEWREEDNYTEESRSQRSSSQGSPVSGHSLSENFNATHSFPGSLHSDTYHTNRAESPQKTSAESLAAKVENSDKRKQLLRAWVSPSEPHPFPAQPTSGTTVSAKHRTHPVKPMNTTVTKTAPTSLGTATIISENLLNEAIIKKYKPSDPEFAYTQLTHDELIQLVLKQKETINKKEFQVRELEDYIDNLLVRVMEETPNILRSPAQLKNKAGKM